MFKANFVRLLEELAIGYSDHILVELAFRLGLYYPKPTLTVKVRDKKIR